MQKITVSLTSSVSVGMREGLHRRHLQRPRASSWPRRRCLSQLVKCQRRQRDRRRKHRDIYRRRWRRWRRGGRIPELEHTPLIVFSCPQEIHGCLSSQVLEPHPPDVLQIGLRGRRAGVLKRVVKRAEEVVICWLSRRWCLLERHYWEERRILLLRMSAAVGGIDAVVCSGSGGVAFNESPERFLFCLEGFEIDLYRIWQAVDHAVK